MEPTIETTQKLTEESTSESSPHIDSLCMACVFDADHNDLKDHLKNHQVPQNILDEYLLSGFQMVQMEHREIEQVAQAMKLLLEFGANWKDGVLLEDQMTPHHVICQSNGDNHELLDLITTHFDRTLINSKSHDGSTALLYAVKNANVKCVKSLIANGANVNLEDDSYADYSSLTSSMQTLSPIVETIRRLEPNSEYSSIVMTDIFDLLLDSGVDVNKPNSKLKPKPIEYATHQENIQCVKKLIERGARLDIIDDDDEYIWTLVAHMGNVELLKCMLGHGITKECTDMRGRSLLSHTVQSGDVEAIRYLLDCGVSMTSGTTRADEIACKDCGENRLLIDDEAEAEVLDPHMVACELDMVDVVQLLEEYGNQDFKSINALRHAVIHDGFLVAKYLLGKYNYPLNVEYAKKSGDNFVYENILIEACSCSIAILMVLLIRHGADPNKSVCNEKCSTALTTAIANGHVSLIGRFIQNGIDINRRSYDVNYGIVYPFETSVLYNNKCAAEMLFISGCSCGVFSLKTDHKFKKNVGPEMEKLMKEWNVHENNVTSLKVQCRRAILNHLSPGAIDKIDKCPLPLSLDLYIDNCELNDIAEKYEASFENSI